MKSDNRLHVKVLMLLDNPFSSDARVEKEAATLIHAGAKVIVVCTKKKGLPEQEVRDGITILRWIEEGYNAPLRKDYKKYLQRTAKKLNALEFSVLHCHDFYMLHIGVEMKKNRNDIRLVYDAHEYLNGWPFYQTTTNWLNRIKGYLVWKTLIINEKKDLKQVNGVLTITEAIAEKMKRWVPKNTSITVLGNYPINENITPAKESLHVSLGIDPAKKILVHAGTIYHSDKELHTLFRVISALKTIVLVFIGNRPRIEEIKKMVDTDPTLKEFVYFYPYSNEQKKNIQVMMHADIGLLHISDKWEAHKIGFSNRFVEYIMAGIPVVATPQAFTKEIQKRFDCCAFYSSEKPEQLQLSLSMMLSELEEKKQNAINASKQMDWRKEAEKIIDFYQNIS